MCVTTENVVMSQPHDGELLIAMLAVVELESSNVTPIANGTMNTVGMLPAREGAPLMEGRLTVT